MSNFLSLRMKKRPDVDTTESPSLPFSTTEKNMILLAPNTQVKARKPSFFDMFRSAPPKSPSPVTMETNVSTNQNLSPRAAAGQELVQMFADIESKFGHLFELNGLEADKAVRMNRTLEEQKALHQWSLPGSTFPSYPPFLKNIPYYEQTPHFEIFDPERSLENAIAMLGAQAPILGNFFGVEFTADTMAGLEAQMERLRREHKSIGKEASIANRADWYSDAVFAQQSFTGASPGTICNASKEWIDRFCSAAKTQGRNDMHQLLKNCKAESIFIQDCSYFREAADASADSTFMSDDHKRYGCASVTLYQLHSDGALHALAIVIDYRASIENSVCIFNQRMSPTDSTHSEAMDWPWRYAKMCAQVSDWTKHEMEVHLSDCHFIFEATMVAAQRSIPADHIVHQILEPHWLKTFSLGAAIRANCLPKIVTEINGFTRAQTYTFLLSAYKNFDWTASYLPSQLRDRGFEPSRMNERLYHNYAWARDMVPMWDTLHTFVCGVLRSRYITDDDVRRDQCILNWCEEMRSNVGGQMAKFPLIKTFDELCDSITMCMHLASPLHNSVNYLQCYYQSFVPAKPASLMTPLPRTLEQLMKFTEKDIVASLPIKDMKVWQLSSMLPYMLSHSVKEDQTLMAYARELGGGTCLREGMCQKAIMSMRMKVAACITCAKTKMCRMTSMGEMMCMDCMGMDRMMPNIMDATCAKCLKKGRCCKNDGGDMMCMPCTAMIIGMPMKDTKCFQCKKKGPCCQNSIDEAKCMDCMTVGMMFMEADCESCTQRARCCKTSMGKGMMKCLDCMGMDMSMMEEMCAMKGMPMSEGMCSNCSAKKRCGQDSKGMMRCMDCMCLDMSMMAAMCMMNGGMSMMTMASCSKCMKKGRCCKDSSGSMKCMHCVDSEHAFCSMDGECMHENTCAGKGDMRMPNQQCSCIANSTDMATTRSQSVPSGMPQKEGTCLRDGCCTAGGMCMNEGACTMDAASLIAAKQRILSISTTMTTLSNHSSSKLSSTSSKIRPGMPGSANASTTNLKMISPKKFGSCLKDNRCTAGGMCLQKGMCVQMAQGGSGMALKMAARKLEENLLRLGPVFEANSSDMDDSIVAYRVLDPTQIAVSILI